MTTKQADDIFAKAGDMLAKSNSVAAPRIQSSIRVRELEEKIIEQYNNRGLEGIDKDTVAQWQQLTTKIV